MKEEWRKVSFWGEREREEGEQRRLKIRACWRSNNNGSKEFRGEPRQGREGGEEGGACEVLIRGATLNLPAFLRIGFPLHGGERCD